MQKIILLPKISLLKTLFPAYCVGLKSFAICVASFISVQHFVSHEKCYLNKG